MKISDNFIRIGMVVMITILSIIGFFNLSKIIGLEKAAQQEQVGEMAFGATFAPGEFIKIETAADSTRPELPYRVYRFRFLTYTLDTIGGEGLPTFVVKDRHYAEGKYGARGKFNWMKDLPIVREEVLEIHGSPVFIGVQ